VRRLCHGVLAAVLCASWGGCAHGPLWDSGADQERTVALWRALAKRYADRSIVAGYDLLNEPLPPHDEQLPALYRRIIAAIRAVDAHHLLFLEGSAFATDFSAFSAPLDANQAYSFHLYTWFSGKPSSAVARYEELGRSQDVPLWCGEYGEASYDSLRGTVAAFRDAAQRGGLAGTSYWTWKHALPRATPGLAGFHTSAEWKKLIAWVTGGGERPTRDEALAGMRSFVEDAQLEHDTVDAQMVDLLDAAPQPAWPGPAGGFVHRVGRALSDGSGRPLSLNGVNLGGWLLWEGWIWGGPIRLLHLSELSQRHIMEKLSEVAGADAARDFEHAVYRDFIASADLARIAGLGFNVVRVPFNARLLDDEAGWTVLDGVLDAAEKAGVYVVLDLHAAPGGQSQYFIADPRPEP
jgi:hypothetical protein